MHNLFFPDLLILLNFVLLQCQVSQVPLRELDVLRR